MVFAIDLSAYARSVPGGDWFICADTTVDSTLSKVRELHDKEYDDTGSAPALIEDVATVIAKYMPLSDLLRLARTSNANYDACTSNRVILPFVHDLGRRLGPGSDRDKLFALDAKVGCYEIDYLTIYRKMLDMYIWPCTSKAVQVGSIFVKLPTNQCYIVVRVQRGRPGGHILYVVPDPPTLDRGWAAVPKNSQDRIWLRHEKQGVIWRYVDAEGSIYQQHR